ncbi:hypothetical protein CK203_098997 [Vitis vinifera]|uniref:Uncharacterized protein n=1 Tax=Vitis vinifera TaxID=29760 RepID=A0A438CHB4_VITVI|nr:hypothetical protein CK203_098997 [Vitis vinifera]
MCEEASRGAFDGLASVNDGEEQIPLSIILADGSTREMASEGDKTMAGEGVGGEFEELLQDLEGKGCRWDDSYLARFNKFLGFSTEGFEDNQGLDQVAKRDLVCLQETKIQDMTQGIIHGLGVGRFLGWGAVCARGAAGGVGGPFTWSGGLNGQSRSRLDRFRISKDWENHFSGVTQCTLPRPVSDHFPILLDGGGVRRARLEEMFSMEEVYLAISELNGDKAPGPNGFPLAF